ncbi:hypothetical protein KEM52_005124, partial [Ascosphaera acerosa]
MAVPPGTVPPQQAASPAPAPAAPQPQAEKPAVAQHQQQPQPPTRPAKADQAARDPDVALNSRATAEAMEKASRAASAAVAAAMARLPPPQSSSGDAAGGKPGQTPAQKDPAVELLTKKVAELETRDREGTAPVPAGGRDRVSSHRGGAGGRGGRREPQPQSQSQPQAPRKVEVPQTDYDF